MKKSIFFFLLISLLATTTIIAQVNGNKKIETKTYDIQDIKTLSLHITADVTIDANSEAALSITTDANIFDKMTVKKTDGKLYINQAVWIEPTQMKIAFGGKAHSRIVKLKWVELNRRITNNEPQNRRSSYRY